MVLFGRDRHGNVIIGAGEDVNFVPGDLDMAPTNEVIQRLKGNWTIDSFSKRLATMDLFGGGTPERSEAPLYRTWAYESAALDLALRTETTTLPRQLGQDVLERAARHGGYELPSSSDELHPLTFVVSLGLGSPPRVEPVRTLLEAHPGTGLKLDVTPEWTKELVVELKNLVSEHDGKITAFDFKGKYPDGPIWDESNADVVQLVATAFPDAVLEDPNLDDSAHREVLKPHLRRVTWDAIIHSVDDVRELDPRPRTLNSKPSRFGSVEALLDFYEFCWKKGIALYGGGQAEHPQGPGRVLAQRFAAIFHPLASNDLAPSGYNADPASSRLPASPLIVISGPDLGYRAGPQQSIVASPSTMGL